MKTLETMTAEQLQRAPYSPVPFLVDELIPEGLHILAGAPKIGKFFNGKDNFIGSSASF